MQVPRHVSTLLEILVGFALEYDSSRNYYIVSTLLEILERLRTTSRHSLATPVSTLLEILAWRRGRRFRVQQLS